MLIKLRITFKYFINYQYMIGLSFQLDQQHHSFSSSKIMENPKKKPKISKGGDIEISSQELDTTVESGS